VTFSTFRWLSAKRRDAISAPASQVAVEISEAVDLIDGSGAVCFFRIVGLPEFQENARGVYGFDKLQALQLAVGNIEDELGNARRLYELSLPGRRA